MQSNDTGRVLAAEFVNRDAPTYFPGRDYPDRDVWLAKRNTWQGNPHIARRIYNSYGRHAVTDPVSGDTLHVRKPLILGINVAKRRALAAGNPNPKHNETRSRIVEHRHAAARRGETA